METMRSIRMRIKSMESTRQITRSMKMVAASKLRKTMGASSALRVYAEQSREMLSDIIASAGRYDNPYLKSREPGEKVMYVLFVGDRGLCGMYNMSVFRCLQELIEADPRECEIVVCGRWGRDVFSGAGIKVSKVFDELSDTPSSEDAAVLTRFLTDAYQGGRADEIILVYQHFGSVLSQSPTASALLPLKVEARDNGCSEYIFEPDRNSVLDKLIDQYIDSTVYSAMLEARAGEHAARMTAMTSASDNTGKLISELNLKLNHARQAAITTEISEIAGGAAALNTNA